MSLVEYQRKRQFDKTREPAPGKPLPEGKRAIFVVQLHHASRRHYDFRLQVGDVLKSWAVPKGPSYDSSVKRMAVEVEDHPLSYATFEGRIPQGQYGGGHVALFDTGVWSTPYDVEAQLAKGHLRFELFGDRLKGGWHLVRSGRLAKQPQWLLFKQDDVYAGEVEADDLLAGVTAPPEADASRAGRGKPGKKKRTTVAPRRKTRRVDWAKQAAALSGAKKTTLKNAAFEPQLARLDASPPQGPPWLHEIKWDGYRLVTTICNGVVRIWSRNAIEWTAKVPEIVSAVKQLGLVSGALDGELVAGAGTQQDFNLLQATLSGEQQGTLVYILFDLLHVNGIAIDASPLYERKQLLARLLEDPPRHLALSTHIDGDGAAAYKLASEQTFEGIISKRADQPYRPGRGDDWRKTKHLQSEEFAVVGATPGKGNRGGFGSLLLARPNPVHGWSYAGRIGSGFSNDQIRAITTRIGKAGSSKPTVFVTDAVRNEIRDALWFDPMFVVEVVVRGTGGSGVLRQASLKALRPDKDIADLYDPDHRATVRFAAQRKTGRKMPSTQAAVAPAPPMRLSSPDKLIFPHSHISKQQVADYYLAVMDYLLPAIAGRPLSVIRCPQGAEKPCFFQKHHTPGLKHVGLVQLNEDAGNNASYLVANDAAGVMELVQLNGLEFHPWGSHAGNPDIADRVIFDLDPGPNVPWSEVKAAAVHVRGLLQRAGFDSFLRTTGGKGLHVVLPLNPGCRWAIVKEFAKGFADLLAKSEPQRFVAVSTLKLRANKIFVDYLRNSRGATAVASYSLRARDGAPVAMPLAWSQLKTLARGDAFTLKDVPARLKRRRRDPWARMQTIQQDLSHWAGG